MGILKKLRNWCPQPPDRLPSKLKRYSMPIAAVVTVSLIFSISFFVFSSTYLFNQPLVQVPELPLSAGAQSSNTFYIGPSNTIYIRPDGSIDPSTAPIKQVGNVYTLTDNITGNNETAIEVQKNNIIIDGAGYTLQGQGANVGGIGIDVSGNNVTVENFLITNFVVCIDLENTTNIKIIQNNITTYTSENGIDVSNSTNNIISNNSIVSYANLDGCQNNGICLSNSFNNTVSKNHVVGSWIGIYFGDTNSSIVGEQRYPKLHGNRPLCF